MANIYQIHFERDLSAGLPSHWGLSTNAAYYRKSLRHAHDPEIAQYPEYQKISNSNAVPVSIAACWGLLVQSQISEELFEYFVATAFGRETTPNRGMAQLDASSLVVFLHFMEAIYPVAAEPEVAISPRGNVQAEWYKNDSNYLILEFRPDGVMMFSLWQDGHSMEGDKAATKAQELINIFDAMDENPLAWVDAT